MALQLWGVGRLHLHGCRDGRGLQSADWSASVQAGATSLWRCVHRPNRRHYAHHCGGADASNPDKEGRMGGSSRARRVARGADSPRTRVDEALPPFRRVPAAASPRGALRQQVGRQLPVHLHARGRPGQLRGVQAGAATVRHAPVHRPAERLALEGQIQRAGRPRARPRRHRRRAAAAVPRFRPVACHGPAQRPQVRGCACLHRPVVCGAHHRAVRASEGSAGPGGATDENGHRTSRLHEGAIRRRANAMWPPVLFG
mmetsp:Transcript_26347/g.65235  ORF Transcript_26347/g.65235 Transcript_26347/m.65235 type:complete len:257 (-) Transcript_26347:778-1548(-)